MPADTPRPHGVEARTGLPPDAAIADLADVFGLLGDPGRMRILLALLGGPLRVNELSDRSGLSPSATSHALRLLRSHRVVEAHREGRTAEYALADEHVRDFLELGLAHVGHTVLVHTVAAPSPSDPAAPEACDPPAHP
ncbi:ArsR/SmtB family transcription factor [Rathayibacter sp. VKM Ac-2754]|uniref:ArsR/SmtB family transcription factor n=1 Tax=Rathayibacter sp. VKM Ac-2754 TaxID=2609251 RepID=UPI00135CA33E|nr:metalloregulator ArsR/SmtB family transcription factor [Rathayibacter sp. VKM Ac-2754]MWV58877.1 metalloregulator ArsR/SmtB family transcription factor [Rathayibacter sp. VKM Ac-2754]